MMSFIVRAVFMSFWLFVAWVALRVWEVNFEVSPLPAILLPISVFLMLFVIAYLLGRRTQKIASLEAAYRYWAMGLVVGGAVLWEGGLTLYLSGWEGLKTLGNGRFLLGVLVQLAGVWTAGMVLRSTYGKAHPQQRLMMAEAEVGQQQRQEAPAPSLVATIDEPVAPLVEPRSPEGTQS